MAEPYDDDPLVRSLREPGTPSELADQDRYVAMFRELRGGGSGGRRSPGSPRRPGGRAARRLGVGTTLSLAIAVAGGGVAAAYTAHLPEPLQQLAHDVLAPVNVPPPADGAPEPVTAAPSLTVEASPEAQPGPAPRAAPADGRGEGPSTAASTAPTSSDEAEPSAGEPSAEPTAAPTDSPDTAATSTPTSTPSTPTETTTPTGPEVPTAASISISGATHRVDYAATPVLSGVVRTDDGTVLPEVRVRLLQRVDGAWVRVAVGTTGADGSVSLTASPVLKNTAVRLRTPGARSPRWRVRVRPDLAMTSSVDGDTVTIVATAVGGQPGDLVRLVGRRDGGRVTLATGLLADDGTTTFQVRQKTPKARYAGILEATRSHTADRVVLQVVRPTPPDSEATPSPSP